MTTPSRLFFYVRAVRCYVATVQTAHFLTVAKNVTSKLSKGGRTVSVARSENDLFIMFLAMYQMHTQV